MELYVHLPFCIRKCRYCDFASFSGAESKIPAYIRLLLREAEIRRDEVEEEIETVYFGGGTPSLVPASEMEHLINGLRSVLPMNNVSEFTVEANPGTVTEVWSRTIHDLGVNRVSLGVQSADNDILSLLGRIHRFEEVPIAMDRIRSGGITNINTDLIFGIPGQMPESWEQTIRSVLDLSPTHISAYGLIPEEGTPLKKDLDTGRLSLPDPDMEREMYSMAVRMLKENGYDRYEISNFAKAGFSCRHNIGYWTLKPYLGLGLSASSMTGIRDSGSGIIYRRISNPADFEDYEKSLSYPEIRGTDIIGPTEARFESVMLGLRMEKGIDEDRFLSLHGVSIESCYGARMTSFVNQGLMMHENHHWFLTDRGMDIQNMILVELMGEGTS